MAKQISSPLCKVAGTILLIVGLAHLIGSALLIDFAATPVQTYVTVLLFGITYTVLGYYVFRGVVADIKIALGVHIVGLITVITFYDISPLQQIDPYLIVLDVVNIPLLAYILISQTHKN